MSVLSKSKINKLLQVSVLFSAISTTAMADNNNNNSCASGYVATRSLDILFQNVNQPSKSDFFVFDIGSSLAYPGTPSDPNNPNSPPITIPAGSHWVAQGTVYPGGSVTGGDTSPYSTTKSAIGKWNCEGGITTPTTVLEASGSVGRDIGLGHFTLVFPSSDPKLLTQLFGNYTARSIDLSQKNSSNRYELKNISSGTGSDLGMKDLIIDSYTYNDFYAGGSSILLKYSIRNGSICVPKAE